MQLPKYISKTESAFRVHVTARCGGKTIYRSIGHKKIGHEAALKKALAVRNELMRQEWGIYASRILSGELALNQLPRKLKPRRYNGRNQPRYIISLPDENGNRRQVMRSIQLYGGLGAFHILSRELQEAYGDRLDFIRFAGRINLTKYS